jgi:glucose/arabinose dehydrogenase
LTLAPGLPSCGPRTQFSAVSGRFLGAPSAAGFRRPGRFDTITRVGLPEWCLGRFPARRSRPTVLTRDPEIPMFRPLGLVLTVLVLFLLLSGSAPPVAAQALRAENVATGFVRPVFLTAPDGDPDRLFVVEKRGIIRIIKNGSVLASPFLDIQSIVDSGGNEEGLLGLAFDPDYETNGFFYVYFVRNLNTSQISRFSVTANPDVADPASELRIFSTSQPFSNHNGGHIEFGPDGYLYWGSGDGGSASDPGNRAQNGLVLLGKMLRIDPNGDDFPADPVLNYAIPPSNPFVGNASVLDEIWALGLRNPYRWAFDEATGDLWIADVGQNCWEEIDWQPAASAGGENYGWRVREGTHCFNPNNTFACFNPDTCPTGFVPPIHEYNHTADGFSCAVTGGRVYNGSAIPLLGGTYFYADYCSNQVYSFRWDGATVSELTNRTSELSPPIGGGTIDAITAFGRDGLGELYIVKEDQFGSNGTIFRIIADPDAVDSPGLAAAGGFALSSGSPNPFTASTRFSVTLDRAAPLAVRVYDAAGRLVRPLHEGVAPAGVFPVTWNGRDLEGRPVAAGVYFLRAETPDEARTTRIIHVR